MADPIIAYLPQLSQALGVNTATPPAATAGTPLQRALVTNAAPLPAPTAAQLQNQFNGLPQGIPQVAPGATPSAPVPATPAATLPVATPQPAVPVPLPGGAVSPTPGEGNPLPPNLQTGIGLPAGTPGTTASNAASVALQGLPARPSNAGSELATPAAQDDGIEVIRGGAVSNVGGANTVVPGGSGIRDPQAAINAGFDTQTNRAEGFIQQAMNYVNAGSNIFERATRGRFVNGLLGATVGPNNVGQVQGQGQDTLNSALAGIQTAGIGAGAQEYGADIGLVGNQQRIGEAASEFANSNPQIGTDVVQTQFGPLPVPRFGVRQGAVAPTAINPAPAPALPAGLRVGATYKGQDGTYNVPGNRKAVVKNGQITSIE